MNNKKVQVNLPFPGYGDTSYSIDFIDNDINILGFYGSCKRVPKFTEAQKEALRKTATELAQLAKQNIPYECTEQTSRATVKPIPGIGESFICTGVLPCSLNVLLGGSSISNKPVTNGEMLANLNKSQQQRMIDLANMVIQPVKHHNVIHGANLDVTYIKVRSKPHGER